MSQFGVSPNSKRKIDRNAATKIKQGLYIRVFRAIKKAVTF